MADMRIEDRVAVQSHIPVYHIPVTLLGGVEIRDRQGTLIGFFHPAIAADEVDQFECPVDEEELVRRARQGGGRRLDEILDDLRKSS
jgi:hypothetical protein